MALLSLFVFVPLLNSFLLGLVRTRTHTDTHTHINKRRSEKREKKMKESLRRYEGVRERAARGGEGGGWYQTKIITAEGVA